LHFLEKVVVPYSPLYHSISLGEYNKMVTHFISCYLSKLHKTEKEINYGYNLHSKNTYNESK